MLSLVLFRKLEFLLIALLLTAISAQAEEPIRLYFVDRPPYAISHSADVPTGVVASPAAKVFKQANIRMVWSKARVNHIFSVIKENWGNVCALGFEQTQSRQAFAQFTDPLYIGQPMVALTSLKVKEKSGVTFTHLLSKYAILFKENYTIGDEITALIKRSPKSYITTIDSIQMVQMISSGAADFMMISNEEIAYFIKHGVLDRNTVRVLALPDLKIRFHRRIMCSKSVDGSIIKRLNAAIATLHVQPAHFDNSFIEQ